MTLYVQFGPNVAPGQVLRALKQVGFDDAYDFSMMCEMVGSATDAFLSECNGPWPKISITCPAVVRLVQIRYPELLPLLVPIETPRELAAKYRRRRLAAELGLAPKEIGLFFITQCTAIMHSIVDPVGLEDSHLDGGFAIADLYGPILKAIKDDPRSGSAEDFSIKGIRWAMAGGEISGMRNANSMTVRGVRDVTRVFDRIESGELQSVDFIEAYICPDGCVSGHLTVAGRYTAQRNLRQIGRRLPEGPASVTEEKVRALLREHFFDIEEEIRARPVKPIAQGLRQAIALHRERTSLLAALPQKDCAACGAPTCATLVDDILHGQARLEDCVFVQIASHQGQTARQGGDDE
jgi:hypothetical protein